MGTIFMGSKWLNVAAVTKKPVVQFIDGCEEQKGMSIEIQ